MEHEKLQIIYKNNSPYGIRDENGYLFFFVRISKFPGQEERYHQEVLAQFALADYLLASLQVRGAITPPNVKIDYFENVLYIHARWNADEISDGEAMSQIHEVVSDAGRAADLWGRKNSELAMAQGWDVFMIEGNSNKLSIQRIDEEETFKSDEEAREFVLNNKGEYKHCALALHITETHSVQKDA